MKPQIGDRVKCNEPGSWLHGLEAEVYALDVTSSDDITGCGLQFQDSDIPGAEHGCRSVVEPENLIVVNRPDLDNPEDGE